MEENNELEQTNQSPIKRGILGFFIGLGVIVPGVSGATIAIIFKLYDKLLYAISVIFKKFKYSFIFLLPIIIGAILGFGFGFLTVQKLLDIIPFAIVLFFVGLMIGALPSLSDEIPKDYKRSKFDIVLLIFGMIIPITISISAIIVYEKTNFTVDLKVNAYMIIIYFIIGMIVALTQIVPGCSATATLMALGFFMPLMDSVSKSYWMDHKSIFIVYLSLVLGFLVGMFLLSKKLNELINKHKGNMYYLFIGLSIGSIIAMVCNTDMVDIYKDFNNDFPYLDVILGVVLFIIGILSAYYLVLYTRKKAAHDLDISNKE